MKEIRIVWQTNGVTKVSKPLDSQQALQLEASLDASKKPHIRVKGKPSVRSLQKWMFNGICPTPDGCKVEPDGTCEHGWQAWLLICGII